MMKPSLITILIVVFISAGLSLAAIILFDRTVANNEVAVVDKVAVVKEEKVAGTDLDIEIIEEGYVFAPTVENGIRTNFADITVLPLSDGTYRAYLLTFNDEAGQDGKSSGNKLVTAVSDDGLNFTIDSDLISTDRRHLSAMVEILEIDDGYRLYSAGNLGSGTMDEQQHVVSSVSDDGISFEQEIGIRVFSDAGNQGAVGSSIVQLDDGRYRLFVYEDTSEIGSGGFIGRIAEGSIYAATSEDGLTWTKDDEVLISGSEGMHNGQALRPAVIRLDDQYILFYNSHTRIMWARSNDGFEFELMGEIGIRGADPEALVLENGDVRIYYGDFDPDFGGSLASAIIPNGFFQ